MGGPPGPVNKHQFNGLNNSSSNNFKIQENLSPQKKVEDTIGVDLKYNENNKSTKDEDNTN